MMGDRLLEKVDKFFHSMEPRWDKFGDWFARRCAAPGHRTSAYSDLQGGIFDYGREIMEVALRPKGKIEESVASEWQNKLARLSRMNWDEVRTRVGQEVHKRSDLLLYRMGVPPTSVHFHKSPSRQPNFFSPDGGAQKCAALLRAHWPAGVLKILPRPEDI